MAKSAFADASISRYADMIETELDTLGKNEAIPEPLRASMTYTLCGGGKRLRGGMCMAACELFGGSAADALIPACALEMIHAYSLIHDDLPAMDDDDMRRGKPSNHIAFGEATAILAGDGLQSLAFLWLSALGDTRVLRIFAQSAFEMVMGQTLDMRDQIDVSQLVKLQDYKTCALFRAAAASGACRAQASEADVQSMMRFATAYGMLFQITDDILDACGSAAVMGKSAGKDAASGKLTFVTAYGRDGAEVRAEACAAEARSALAAMNAESGFFSELIDRTLDRRA